MGLHRVGHDWSDLAHVHAYFWGDGGTPDGTRQPYFPLASPEHGWLKQEEVPDQTGVGCPWAAHDLHPELGQAATLCPQFEQKSSQKRSWQLGGQKPERYRECCPRYLLCGHETKPNVRNRNHDWAEETPRGEKRSDKERNRGTQCSLRDDKKAQIPGGAPLLAPFQVEGQCLWIVIINPIFLKTVLSDLSYIQSIQVTSLPNSVLLLRISRDGESVYTMDIGKWCQAGLSPTQPPLEWERRGSRERSPNWLPEVCMILVYPSYPYSC